MKPTYTLEQLHCTDRLPCTRCDGTKTLTYPGLDLPSRPCTFCDGSGHFDRPDVPALLQAIKGRKGLRSKRPDSDRAYYVWRNVRFTAGIDVTMPVTASFAVTGDPYVPCLDLIVKSVAQRVYGVSGAGEARWLNALGYDTDTTGMPASAQPGGPVVLDNNKPYSEQLELV